ncbi:MAG TPA: DUF3179 domain-containing protein [Thermoanaerobaculia bacterium]|nr:DUF3179 domain-containing protein [Thermoanaerobaculia bacterium]
MVLASPAGAVPPGYEPLERLVSVDGEVRREAAREIVAGGDRSLIPGIVDAVFFVKRLERLDLYTALEGLTGEKLPRSFYDWVEWVGAHPEIKPKEGYPEWKLSLLQRIDRRFAAFLYRGAPMRVRLEEVVWGGVKVDGIPSLDDPAVLPAAEARGMRDDEAVFGVSLGGAQRAYPVRILSWHEMTNDVVGGEPIALSYCTLCGSAILYGTRTPKGSPYRFGTSGLLYRSNKLMFDRSSYTLWSNITGEPVIGRLANSSVRLPMLPVTRTTWKEWRERFPDTTVVSLEQEAGKRAGYEYLPGAADRARRDVKFPVWQKSNALPRDEEVFALRIGSATKAYPLAALYAEKLVQDRLGETDLLLLADPSSGAVRAYDRSGKTFAVGPTSREVKDDSGARWKVEEEGLVRVDDPTVRLPRVAGHIAFWFGWYGFYPETEIYKRR